MKPTQPLSPMPYPKVVVSRAVGGVAFVHLIVGDWTSATVAHGTPKECRGHRERLEWALKMLDKNRIAVAASKKTRKING